MTTPFSPYPAAYAGARPDMGDPISLIGSGRAWLGRIPSTWGMIELPTLDPDGYQMTPASNSVSPHTLITGATVTHILTTRARQWVIDWPGLELRDMQVVDGFHARAFGNAPWAFVNPEGRNRLTYKQSLCQDATVWGTNGGTITTDPTPGYIPPSGSILWDPSASAKYLVANSVVSGVTVPDPLRSMPYVPAEPSCAYFYVRAQTGTASVFTRITGVLADGTGAVSVAGASVTVGTTPLMVAAVAAPGAFGSTLYLLPKLVSNDGNPVLVSCPQTSYTDEAVDWGTGEGVPRVTTPNPPDTASYLGEYDLTRTLVLAETITGAV